MVKAILILMGLLLAIAFAFVTMTATPNDINEYKRYEAWKEQIAKHENNISDLEEIMFHNCVGYVWTADDEERDADDE